MLPLCVRHVDKVIILKVRLHVLVGVEYYTI